MIVVCLCLSVQITRCETVVSQPFPGEPAFKHRGFYLHGGWFFKYPFAVRTWQRNDYANMFVLLKQMGYDRVMIWPMLEAIPAPLSEEDAAALRAFRLTLDDARAAGLECWVTQCPNLASPSRIAAKPWPQRNPYPVWKHVRLDDPVAAKTYLAHRTALMSILNNADGYVTIDGDPGGYAGARPEDWLKVFLSDRAVIDRSGFKPQQQKIIPWVWCGWGAKGVWREPIEPYVRASIELLGKAMPEPWEMLPGRSHRDEGHANGRINISFTDQAGLMGRSTILCYEAIEFEPSIPAAVLQFDIIRKVLRKESSFAPVARGVFGNAQQPVMVLPNMYFFARASWDLGYLDRSDEQVLADLADLLGGPREILIPAWSCLRLRLDLLPEELPAKLRTARLTSLAGKSIPSGPERYLDILASQVESRRGLLQAISLPVDSDELAAVRIADGITALVNWWKMHGYVGDGNGDEAFEWRFVNSSQVSPLKQWCQANVKSPEAIVPQVARLLETRNVLAGNIAKSRVAALFGK